MLIGARDELAAHPCTRGPVAIRAGPRPTITEAGQEVARAGSSSKDVTSPSS